MCSFKDSVGYNAQQRLEVMKFIAAVWFDPRTMLRKESFSFASVIVTILWSWLVYSEWVSAPAASFLNMPVCLS